MNKKILLLYFNYQVKNYAGIKKAVPRKKIWNGNRFIFKLLLKRNVKNVHQFWFYR